MEKNGFFLVEDSDVICIDDLTDDDDEVGPLKSKKALYLDLLHKLDEKIKIKTEEKRGLIHFNPFSHSIFY